MVDFIFAVRDPESWHRENLLEHKSHYSGLSLLGPRAISAIQDYGAGIYYNPYVPFNEKTKIKYGVIGVDRVVDDLLNWKHLYVAGRLHKPVRIIRNSPEVEQALSQNRQFALQAALLLLEPEFGEHNLYEMICRLSYMGDVRMGVAEHPNKVHNIVRMNEAKFCEIYHPLMKKMPNVYVPNCSDQLFKQDMDFLARAPMLSSLPLPVRLRIHETVEPGVVPSRKSFNIDQNVAPGSQFWVDLAKDPSTTRMALIRSIGNTVGRSSSQQSIKGVFTAGLSKSLQYGLSKLRKARG